jgi:ATP-dependent DNA helicase RecG
MTLYGDLDVSILDEMPPGRQIVKTKWLKEKQIATAYKHIEQEISNGRQCFIVCPRIEMNKNDENSGGILIEDKPDIKAATSLYNNLSSGTFSNRRTELIHGRMKSAEKEEIMTRMTKGEIDLLISTTIIEVGIDISNATIMVIHGAERFGLAQLHQLRGRVGRGKHQSTCYLISDAPKEDQQKRLQALESTNDGFKVAETDLEIRGPGDFFGTQQSGIPPLQVADLLRDLPILEIARKEAFEIIERDPGFTEPENRGLGELIKARFHHLVYFRS